jgi:outer membrane protein assembly factor BamB
VTRRPPAPDIARRGRLRLVGARPTTIACAALAALLLAAGCGADRRASGLDGDRSAPRSALDAATVGRLDVRWRFRIPGPDTFSGVDTAAPVVSGDTVYLQDMDSDVWALDRETGHVLWRTRFRRRSPGPNGVAVADGRVYGNTDRSTFALDAATGALVWVRRLTTPAQPIDVPPVAAGGLVYTSTVGLPPGGKGAIVALDAATGAVRWRFSTIRGRWAVPREAGGGGLWWPVSVDGAGRIYAGNANPYPWGGTRRHPNGGAYRGRALYTDSLLVLDGATGRLEWHDQVISHDVRDYDFAVTPMLAIVPIDGHSTDIVVGAGKGGRVVAWNRDTHARLWESAVGVHRNDTGPLPRRPVTVCPGLLGGVLTPMAYASGRIFVPVVDLCMQGSAFGYPRFVSLDYSKGHGELVALDAATGARIWRRTFSSPDFGCATASNDVVFTATYDGRVFALAADDGRTLWTGRAPAGINACPAVDGDMLLVGAGADPRTIGSPVHELIAYALG